MKLRGNTSIWGGFTYLHRRESPSPHFLKNRHYVINVSLYSYRDNVKSEMKQCSGQQQSLRFQNYGVRLCILDRHGAEWIKKEPAKILSWESPQVIPRCRNSWLKSTLLKAIMVLSAFEMFIIEPFSELI